MMDQSDLEDGEQGYYVITVPPCDLPQRILIPIEVHQHHHTQSQASNDVNKCMPCYTNKKVSPLNSNGTLIEDYDLCADFSVPRNPAWTKNHLRAMRILANAPLLILAMYTFKTSDWGDLIYYESEWGVMLSALASIFMFLADFDKRVFNEPAVLLQEISFCLNCIITPTFWLFMASSLFKPLPHNEHGYWLMFIWGSHHVFPIVSSILNLAMT